MDRTACQLTIYACPPEERAAALAAINEAGLGEEWGDLGGNNDELVIGRQYVDHEASADMSDSLGYDLIAAAPGASFVVWSDPKYEWLGGLVIYTPELGRFDADCDANGNAVVASEAVRRIIKETLPEGIVDALRQKLGMPWEDAIKALLGSDEVQAEIRADMKAAGAL